MKGKQSESMAVVIQRDQATGKQLLAVVVQDIQQRRPDDFRGRHCTRSWMTLGRLVPLNARMRVKSRSCVTITEP